MEEIFVFWLDKKIYFRGKCRKKIGKKSAANGAFAVRISPAA